MYFTITYPHKQVIIELHYEKLDNHKNKIIKPYLHLLSTTWGSDLFENEVSWDEDSIKT